MIHCFEAEHAQNYGLLESILIHNFQHWITQNKANGTNEHDGRTWTYNSVRAYAEQFPYATPKQIRTALESLVERKVMMIGQYSENPANRSNWYAFVDEEVFIHLPCRANGVPSKANAFALQGKSTNTTNSKQDSKPDTKAKRASAPAFGREDLIEFGVQEQIADDFLAVRKAKRAPLTETALDAIKREAGKAGLDLNAALRICVERNWQSFMAEWILRPTASAPGAAAKFDPVAHVNKNRKGDQ